MNWEHPDAEQELFDLYFNGVAETKRLALEGLDLRFAQMDPPFLLKEVASKELGLKGMILLLDHAPSWTPEEVEQRRVEHYYTNWLKVQRGATRSY